jgi:response regulator RpfG family c-di-GMP phosphodiesterase
MASDPIKILIVDDDEEVLISLERLLESEGYSTATAWGGREALALSEKLHFDLLLVDEHVGDALLDGLKTRQPSTPHLLMHTRKGQPPPAGAPTVCKWEHAEMKARIRHCLRRPALFLLHPGVGLHENLHQVRGRCVPYLAGRMKK